MQPAWNHYCVVLITINLSARVIEADPWSMVCVHGVFIHTACTDDQAELSQTQPCVFALVSIVHVVSENYYRSVLVQSRDTFYMMWT